MKQRAEKNYPFRLYCNDGWKFSPSFDAKMRSAGFDDSAWESVRLPHTCKEVPFHYFDETAYQMLCCYRRHLQVPAEWTGNRIFFTLEGVGHDSAFYLNGEKLAEHHCGYTAFSVELTDHLKYGADNVIAVCVNSRESINIPPFGFLLDYMTFGGIYRDAYLELTQESRLKDLFLYAQPKHSPARSNWRLFCSVCVDGPIAGLSIRQSIRQKGSGAYRVLGSVPVAAPQAAFHFDIDEVIPWDVDRPRLYEIKTELVKNSSVLASETLAFGFRHAEFREDGFYLNGHRLLIRGLNRHQSYPYVGYAMPESMQRMDADILKFELGLNAVRTSHYPQSHYFLNRCDELGLLVFTEGPGWQFIGDEAWKKQALHNIRDMVLQYRNHTSIILWGVRINESLDDDEFYQEANRIAHELDPSRQTGGVRAIKNSSFLEDVYTYNDFYHNGSNDGCEPKSAVTPDSSRPYLIAEYGGHMYPTKAFDSAEHRTQHAVRHANTLDAVAGLAGCSGSFGWCMADYYTHKDFGSGDRICYHGVLDMFRNPKLAADIYASQQEQTPVLSVSSSMEIGDRPASGLGEVYLFTNADSVRLYKNGMFIHEFSAGSSPWGHLPHGPIPVDDFVGDALERLEHLPPADAASMKKLLNAMAVYGFQKLPQAYLDKNPDVCSLCGDERHANQLYAKYVGNWGSRSISYRFDAVTKGSVVKTVVREPAREILLTVSADHTELIEHHSYDVAAVRIRAIDQNGNLLNYYNEPVVLKTEGPISLIGPSVISLHGGMGGTYVKTTGKEGPAHLYLSAEQTGQQKIDFTVASRIL